MVLHIDTTLVLKQYVYFKTKTPTDTNLVKTRAEKNRDHKREGKRGVKKKTMSVKASLSALE